MIDLVLIDLVLNFQNFQRSKSRKWIFPHIWGSFGVISGVLYIGASILCHTASILCHRQICATNRRIFVNLNEKHWSNLCNKASNLCYPTLKPDDSVSQGSGVPVSIHEIFSNCTHNGTSSTVVDRYDKHLNITKTFHDSK